MAQQIIDVQSSSSQNVNKTKKKSTKSKKKSREMLILPETDTIKGKIMLSISEVGKQKEYFTSEDIFSSLIGKMQIDLNNIKRIKSLYYYIARVMEDLEEQGYLKGYYVPGSRKIHWKLMKPLFS